MIAVGQRRDPIRLFWQRLFIVGLVLAVFFGIWAVWGVYWKERESYELRAQAEARYADLVDRETKLAASIAALDSEKGKERALRNSYQVGKDGEGLVVIVDQTPEKPVEATSTSPKWFQKIFGR